MAAVLETDAWYWLPDEEHYMVPAKLLSYGGGSAKFELESGQQFVQRVKTELKLDPLDPQCLDPTISNLIELQSLSEKSVLHLLRIRFLRNDIYTLVSGILIACNPFTSLPIYDTEKMDTYRKTRDHSTLPPHIFSLANEAYVNMVQTGSPQSVVISGESGAGKTESIKLILKYLARLSEITSASSKSVQDQILNANPVLEAFGNAKTSRNDNSSRFGKLITVGFAGGAICQASIISYLLEKSRVVHQQKGERNFHIFYQLLAECSADPKSSIKFGLQQCVDKYSYMSDPEASYVYNMDELDSFQSVEKSMTILEINKAQQNHIFQVVASVLRLGNLQFRAAETEDARAVIYDMPELERISETLGLKQSEMARLLVSRNFGVRSIVTCFFSVQQAKETRDAFSKAIYAYLFHWLIKLINLKLSHGTKLSNATGQFIALLDIFGFENFETNSFEQLLINYCNEKLQYHFNSHIFVMEQEAYKLEDINIDYFDFKDNSATLAVLEMKVTGILSMIDEEINIPKGCDSSLLNKILSSATNKDFVSRAKPSSRKKASTAVPPPSLHSSFAIKHYAGDVIYNISGFLEKNKDDLSSELAYLGKNSSVPFVAEIFACQTFSSSQASSTSQFPSNRTPTKARGPTIANQFKKQLGDLIATLNSTSPFFVRCMKSNHDKVGRVFDSNLMLRQLQYSGLLEVCRIRQEGFPYRIDFQGFHCMYHKLHPSSATGPLLARDLECKGFYGPNDYRVGKLKIFLKYETGQKLEQLRGESINDAAKSCQSVVKIFLAKCRLKKLLQACDKLREAAKAKDRKVLEEVVDLMKESIPNEGLHLEAVQLAKAALARIYAEEPTMILLRDALHNKDYSGMEVGLSQARSMSPPISDPLVDRCEHEIKQYLERRMTSMKESFNNMSALSNSGKKSPPPIPHLTPSELPSSSSTSKPKNTGDDGNESAACTTGAEKNVWGSPSAIRAANGKMARPPRSTSSFTKEKQSLNSLLESDEKMSKQTISNTKGGRDAGVVDTKEDDDQIVSPSEDFKSRKRSVLNRQLSSEQIGIATEVHHMIEVLHNLCISEVGINENDIKPLDIMLKKINIRECDVSREVAEMMMAEQELIRAKKQLLLQAAVDKVTPKTPLWKLKNLIHQSRQLGMENYHGCRNLDNMIDS